MRAANRHLLVAFLSCIVAQAQAATVDISVEPVGPQATVGDSLAIQLVGNYGGPEFLLGGALNLTFDPTIIAVDDVTVAPATGSFDFSNGVVDNSAGTVTGIGFASFTGLNGSFIIATINLTAIAPGAGLLVLSDANDLIFTWTNSDYSVSPFGDSVTPQFTGGSITVAPVPLPLPFLLLAAGMTGLGFSARRRLSSPH